MKPSKNVRRSRTRIKQKGSGVELSEGPLDTKVHAHMTQAEMNKHIESMNKKKEKIDSDIQKENEKVTGENSRLEALKQNDDQKMAALEERNYQAIAAQEQRESTESMAAVQNFSGAISMFAGFIAWLVGRIVVGLYIIGRCIAFLVMNMRKAFGFIVTAIGRVIAKIASWIGSVLNGRLVSSVSVPAFKVVFGVIFFFIICIILLLFILMIFNGISYLMFGVPGESTTTSTSCKNVTEIDLFNFGNPYKTVKSEVSEWISYRPTYPSIPDYEFTVGSVVSNPLTSLNNYMDLKLNEFMNYGLISTITDKARYGFNVAKKGVQYISGVPVASDLIDRKEIKGGRSDNVLIVDSDMFDKNSLSNTLNLKDTSLTMVRPNDIKWSMPESEYNYKDIAKVPPSLLKLKNKDGLSLSDKKDVVIPWVIKDNFYSLSCSDAYFKNNVKEKANILIDGSDGKTCVFDIDSKTEAYKENARRYSYVNDLSSYL